jgi:hypothetical protein
MVVKKSELIKSIKSITSGFCALALIGCSGLGTIVKMPEVKSVPEGKYESIIKLENPAAAPEKKFAGLVFIKKGASVCTDYPRQEIIKSLDDLTVTERNSYSFFSNYAIAKDGQTFGFVSVPIDYTAMLWETEKDESCKYKVQITWVDERNGSISDERNKAGHGGGHGR